jgi:hypothetical protein
MSSKKSNKRTRSPSSSSSKKPKSKKQVTTPSLHDLTITFSQKSFFNGATVTGIMSGIISQDTPFFLKCFGKYVHGKYVPVKYVPCMRCLVEVNAGIAFYIFYWNKTQYDPHILIQGKSGIFNSLLSKYINYSEPRKDFSKWLLDNISPFQKGDRPLTIDFDEFWGSITKELIYIIIDRIRFDSRFVSRFYDGIQSSEEPRDGIPVIDLSDPENRGIFTDSTFFCDISRNAKGGIGNGNRLSKRSNKKLRKTMKKKSTISSFSP